MLGCFIWEKTVTFTKYLTIQQFRTQLNIPKQSWNFFDSQPGHSKCIMQLLGEWLELNTFAVVRVFKSELVRTIY